MSKLHNKLDAQFPMETRRLWRIKVGTIPAENSYLAETNKNSKEWQFSVQKYNKDRRKISQLVTSVTLTSNQSHFHRLPSSHLLSYLRIPFFWHSRHCRESKLIGDSCPESNAAFVYSYLFLCLCLFLNPLVPKSPTPAIQAGQREVK